MLAASLAALPQRCGAVLKRTVELSTVPYPAPGAHDEGAGVLSAVASLQDCGVAPAAQNVALAAVSTGASGRVWGGYVAVSMYNAAEGLGQFNEVALDGLGALGVAGGAPGAYSLTKFALSADEAAAAAAAASGGGTVTVANADPLAGWLTCTAWARLVVNVAADVNFTIAEGGALAVPAPGLLASNADPSVLTLLNVSAPQHGAVAFDANGSFTYAPDDDEFWGEDSFAFTIGDANGATVTANATIIIGELEA